MTNPFNPVTHPLNWGGTVKRDFFDVMIGECLGGGAGRHVYECKLRDDLVIKVELPASSFQNIEEWNVWGDVHKGKWAKWFAPCETISPCGTVLLQCKTTPIEKLPKRLPDMFCDLKPENFGMIGDRIVCHDYGYHRLSTLGLSSTRMRSLGEGERS